MSRRGGSRRQVVQLDDSSSNLHLTSNDKTSASLKLLGDYSDSDSDGSGGDTESNATAADAEPALDPSETDTVVMTDSVTADDAPVDDVSEEKVMVEKVTEVKVVEEKVTEVKVMEEEVVNEKGEEQVPSAMDDELRIFLSEIEAIPMPPDLQGAAPAQPDHQDSPQLSPAPLQNVTEPPADLEPLEERLASPEPEAPVKPKAKSKYSMFIKGDTEFKDHSTEKKSRGIHNKENPEKEMDLPEEPTTLWQMVQDEASQYYYYWNWKTNEVTWEIPAGYTQYLLLHQEYERKVAKLRPDQLKAMKAKQERLQRESGADADVKADGHRGAAASHGTPAGMIGPLLPNGKSSVCVEEESASSRSHAKKKKSHKKHKKRRHRDEEGDSEQDEDASTKPSNGEPPAAVVVDKPTNILTSIVPYLSDDESESKDNSFVESEKGDDEPQADVKDDASPSKPNEPDGPVECLSSGVEPASTETEKIAEVKIACKEENSGEDGLPILAAKENVSVSPKASATEDVKPSSALLESDPAPREEEEPFPNPLPEVKVEMNEEDNLSAKDSESLSPTSNHDDDGAIFKDEQVLDVKEENIFEFKEEVEESDETTSPSPLNERLSATDLGDYLKQEALEEEEKVSPEVSYVHETENVKMEVEEGEISDSNDALIFKKSEVPKSVSASPTIDSTNGKKAPGNILKLIGYESNNDDEEEEEGELREPAPERKVQEERKHYKAKTITQEKDKTEKVISVLRQSSHTTNSDSKSSIIKDGVHNSDRDKTSSQLPERTAVSDDDVDAEDINFDDVEDIDRVLEMVLEKKLEEKKVAKVVEQPKQAATPGQRLDSGGVVDSTKTDERPKQSGDADEKVHSNKSIKGIPDSNGEDELKTKIRSMVERALNKLDFLEIGANTLSKLQILYVVLQTRFKDWDAGALTTVYMYEQMQQAETLLEQYEVSAVPDGWSCQWDRAKCCYFYRNLDTNHVQLDYPQPDRKSSREKEEKRSNAGDRRRREKESSEVEEGHRQHGSSSRSSRHRKKDDKDRTKHDRRSSDRHRKKRRRRRAHSSSSSNSDNESTRSHQHHHKSRRKKKRKSERSPSVEVVGDIELPEPHLIVDSPPPPVTIDDATEVMVLETSADVIKGSLITDRKKIAQTDPTSSSLDRDLVADYSSEPEGEKAEASPGVDDGNDIDGLKIEEEEEGKMEEENNAAVISKPPQIIVPPHVVAMNPPELYPTFSSGSVTAAALPVLASQPTTAAISESPGEAAQPLRVDDGDKAGKKKKKEKMGKEKALATGSSMMMKKKRVSSMVQKWQQVKKQVEKEDHAKELRQAAIREKINQLK